MLPVALAAFLRHQASVKHMNIGEANRCLHCPGSRLVLIYKEAG